MIMMIKLIFLFIIYNFTILLEAIKLLDNNNDDDKIDQNQNRITQLCDHKLFWHKIHELTFKVIII